MTEFTRALENLRFLVAKFGNQGFLAGAMKLTGYNQQRISALAGKHPREQLTFSILFDIEHSLHIPPGWMRRQDLTKAWPVVEWLRGLPGNDRRMALLAINFGENLVGEATRGVPRAIADRIRDVITSMPHSGPSK